MSSGLRHYPDSLGPAFFAQLYSEERVERLVRGRLRISYEKASNKVRNEILDSSVYSMAAKELLVVCFGRQYRPENYKPSSAKQLVTSVSSAPADPEAEDSDLYRSLLMATLPIDLQQQAEPWLCEGQSYRAALHVLTTDQTALDQLPRVNTGRVPVLDRAQRRCRLLADPGPVDALAKLVFPILPSYHAGLD